jgi:hypothetical protein
MKTGDLVRHRFDGRWDEVGVILSRKDYGKSAALIEVMWCHDTVIRHASMRDLELVLDCHIGMPNDLKGNEL